MLTRLPSATRESLSSNAPLSRGARGASSTFCSSSPSGTGSTVDLTDVSARCAADEALRMRVVTLLVSQHSHVVRRRLFGSFEEPTPSLRHEPHWLPPSVM